MRTFDSSITRLMMAVATAAVAFETLQSQSDFWLGALATLATLWTLYAFACVIGGDAHKRAFWLGFLICCGGLLFVGFGPWSDRSIRGDFSNTVTTRRLLKEGQPTTWSVLWLTTHLVRQRERAEVTMLSAAGDPVVEIVVTRRRAGRWINEQLAEILGTAVKEDIRFFNSFRQDYPTTCRVVTVALDVYLDAGYITVALALGALGGLLFATTGALVRRKRTSRQHGDAHGATRDESLLATATEPR